MAAVESTPRARAKREQIRQAARRLFLRHGFAGTTMDAITAEARVSKQTLYVYYRGKEELLADVLSQLIDGLSQDQLSLAKGTPSLESRDELKEALAALAQGIITRLMQPDYLALVRVIIAETPTFPHLASLFRSTVPERVFQGVSGLLWRAQERGLAAVSDTDAAARMFVGPLLTYVLLDGLFSPDGEPHPPAPEQIGAIVDLFLTAIA